MSAALTICQPSASVLNPYVTTDRRANLSIRFAVYDTLVTRGASGQFEPGLATSWEVSPDAKTWIFKLRQDVLFHDGQTLQSQDVLDSIGRVLDPSIEGELGTSGVIQSYLANVQAETVDSGTVRVQLEHSLADLLDLLVELPITSNAMQGSGRYRIESIAADRVDMVAFPEHWSGSPQYSKLSWVGMRSPASRVDFLQSGPDHLVSDIPRDAEIDVLQNPDLALTRRWSATCVSFLINCAKGVGSNRDVRRALNLGLDKKALIDSVVDDDGEMLNGPLTPLHFAYDSAVEPFPYLPDTAAALLDQAGFKGGISLEVDVPVTLPDEAPRLARVMAQQWSQIGVETAIRAEHDREKYAHRVRNKDIGDAACFDSSPLSSFRVLREKLHSQAAGPWWQGYANPEVDSLIDQAAATSNDADRQRVYHQAYKLIREDAPWVFLYRPAYRWASNRKTAWTPTAGGWIRVF